MSASSISSRVARRRGDGAAPVDLRLIADPLAFLAEEHVRQRRICAYLDALSVPGGGDMRIAADALAHLVDEAPAHALDEEDDLFPLLRRRALPEDNLEATLTRLDGDHEHGRTLAEIAKPILAAMAKDGCASVGDRRRMLTLLAGHERRHLIVENAIILPLAAARLTASDLRTLSLRMAARRGRDLAVLEAGDEGLSAGA